MSNVEPSGANNNNNPSNISNNGLSGNDGQRYVDIDGQEYGEDNVLALSSKANSTTGGGGISSKKYNRRHISTVVDSDHNNLSRKSRKSIAAI